MNIIDIEIIQFWNWFRNNSNHLNSSNYDSSILNKLDQQVSDWGFSWEIGPGLKKEHSLTISPNGDTELIERANRIIDFAPNLDGWEFYSSRQPKENWHLLELDSNHINAIDWKYILLKDDSNKVEILLKADNIVHLNSLEKEEAVNLILINLLGENRKNEELDFIDIVDSQETLAEFSQLNFLPKHLDKLKNDY